MGRVSKDGAASCFETHCFATLLSMRPSESRRKASMQQRPLGNSNLDVSAVGLGCNNFGRRIA